MEMWCGAAVFALAAALGMGELGEEPTGADDEDKASEGGDWLGSMARNLGDPCRSGDCRRGEPADWRGV